MITEWRRVASWTAWTRCSWSTATTCLQSCSRTPSCQLQLLQMGSSSSCSWGQQQLVMLGSSCSCTTQPGSCSSQPSSPSSSRPCCAPTSPSCTTGKRIQREYVHCQVAVSKLLASSQLAVSKQLASSQQAVSKQLASNQQAIFNLINYNYKLQLQTTTTTFGLLELLSAAKNRKGQIYYNLHNHVNI